MLKRLLAGLALFSPLLAAPAFAMPPDAFALGYAVGYSPTLQYSSELSFRGHPLGNWSEGTFSFRWRDQALSPDSRYVMQSSGLAYSLGGALAFVRAGVGFELALLKEVVQTGAGTLAFANKPGLVVEPYLGVLLPFLNTPVSDTELTLRYPLYTNDPAIGPRLMFSIWLGGSPSSLKELKTVLPKAPEKPSDEASPAPGPQPKP